MTYDFANHKFRCSSLGHLMTEPRSKAAKDAGELSESAKTHCMDIFISQQYGRQTDIHNKFIKKGFAVEEDAITLYSRVSKTLYKKNDKRLFNDYIQGEPDIYLGPVIEKSTHVKDIKSSWDIFTFFRTYNKELKSIYEWQGKGYAWLTSAENASIAYCLVNTPEPIIDSEKQSIWHKLGRPEHDNENFIDACKVLERSMIYDDIPMKQRVLEYDIDLSGDWQDQIIKKVRQARGYLVSLQCQLVV